jgi:bla regulator protein blaR1
MLLFLAAFLAFGVWAQAQILHPTADLPSFEVATIKPWKRIPTMPRPSDGSSAPVKVMKASPVGVAGQSTNRVQMILPAALLIASAYNLPVGSESRILGLPNWMQGDIDQYEIQARIDESEFAAMQKMTPLQQRERVELMEQSLLAERFKLKVHFETKEMPVYKLIVAKGGSKLARANDGESASLTTTGNQQGMSMTATAVKLDQFVQSPLLTGAAGGRVVLDQTGLTEAYSFTLNWQPDGLALPDAPSLFTALQEQLGLRMVASRAPVEVIVIDHVEPPSAN